MSGYIDIDTACGIVVTVTDWFPLGEGLSIASAWKLDALRKLMFLQEDVAPVKRGKWEIREFDDILNGISVGYLCCVCNTTWDEATAYCPNCGAKMEVEE